MQKSIVTLILVVVLCIGSFLTCFLPAAMAASSSEAEKVLKIGFVSTLSGPVATAGKQMVNGIQLYADEVHHKFAGRPVQLIVENDEGNPATAIAKVRKLVEQDKVDVLAGVLLANIGYAVAPVVDQLQVPMLYPVSAADDLTKHQHHKWVIRNGWSCSQPSHPFGEWVSKNLGYKKIVTFANDYPFGYECVGGFQKSFEESGGKIVQKIWAPLGFTDFTSAIKSIHKDADAVFLVTVGASADIIPKQFKEMGMNLPILATVTSFDEFVLPDIGDKVVGGVSASIYSAALNTPDNQKFAGAYRRAYHEEPNYYAESCYTTGMWIEKALEATKGDVSNKEAFLAALKGVELRNAPRGPLKLDEFGNPIQNIYIRKVTKVNGKYENKVTDTIQNVSQFWKYKPSEFLKQPVYSKDYPQ
jgi:branched-chain amino acid transport system substrate-binding protein